MIKCLFLLKIITMSVARVGLSIELTVSDACDTITLTDDTGQYNITTNPLGYGLPTGATSNSVTSLTIVVLINGVESFTYVFTISSGTITAATLALEGEDATTITSELASTVFPLTDFDLWGDYGVTLPEFGDGVYEVDYTIEGRIDPVDAATAYSYTTSESVLVSCALCCCLSKVSLEIDVDCEEEFEDKMMKFMRISTYGKVANYAMQVGKNEDAIKAFNKAVELCDCNCGC